MRSATAALLLVMAAGLGCGEEPTRVQVSVVATREGEPLDFEKGGVELGSDVVVSAVLLRLESLRVETGDDSVSSPAPVNLDLFTSTIVLEEELVGDTLSQVVLEVPAPAAGGVIPGEAISVYVTGVWDTAPFEYRDASMEPIMVPTSESVQARITVGLDLKRWFHDIDDEDLALTGGRFLIDASHNTAAAAQIEAAIRSSVSIGEPCDDCDDNS